MSALQQDAAAAPPALIFVVEDDAAISQLVVAALHEYGFATEAFRSGGALLRRLPTARPALCVVDLGLPDMDGIDLLSQIGALSGCGVLILTGRGHMVDRVMGLELGADDYMVKPFEPRELVARVRSILRRHSGTAVAVKQRRHASSSWSRPAANILRAPDGTEHLLGSAETQALRAFLERPHQILTREQLVGQRELSASDRSIDVRISRLRRKLEGDPRPATDQAVYGAGDTFAAAVSWT
ncbi:response regulator transcription factor [Roseateles sp. GG27B]